MVKYSENILLLIKTKQNRKTKQCRINQKQLNLNFQELSNGKQDGQI